MADDDLDMLLSSARAARPRRLDGADSVGGAATPQLTSADDSIDAVLPGPNEPRHTERRKRWMLGLSVVLVAVAFSGLLTDAVAASQLLSSSGPWSLAVVWPLGGLSLLATAAVQSRFVDRFARVSVLVGLLVSYAAAFGVLLLLVAIGVTTAVPAAMAWLLADQMNFLLPLVVWSLASDVFTAGEALNLYPRMSRWLYAGQFVGLGVATLGGWVWRDAERDLLWLLALAPMACLIAALVAPRLLRDATTGAGHQRHQSSAEATRDTMAFLRDLPSFWWLLKGSFAVMLGGTIVEFSYFELSEARTDGAGHLQALYAGITLLGFVLCWVVQSTIGLKVLARMGAARSLAVLPAAVVLAALVALAAGLNTSVSMAAAALLLWRLPRWSLDASARQAAFALLPDERRGRASFAIDLVPLATALVVSAAPIALMLGTHQRWTEAVLGVLLGVAGLWCARAVIAGWETTQLSYRLKRRKRLT